MRPTLMCLQDGEVAMRTAPVDGERTRSRSKDDALFLRLRTRCGVP